MAKVSQYKNCKKRLDLLAYLFHIGIQSPFHIGKMTFHIDDKKIYLYYKKNGDIISSMDLAFDVVRMGMYGIIKRNIQEFVINAYMHNEWDGKPLSMDILGKLMGMDINEMEVYVSRILSKLRERTNVKL